MVNKKNLLAMILVVCMIFCASPLSVTATKKDCKIPGFPAASQTNYKLYYSYTTSVKSCKKSC